MAQQRSRRPDCRDFQISSTANWEDSLESLEAILGTRWRLHWVTPLWDLQYTEARLKQYASHLRGALHTEESATRLQVSVTPLPQLRRADDAPVPLQISVDAVNGENRKQSLYRGIMLSWTKCPRPQQENWVHLPLLICRGGIKVTESVHNMLHSLLNCNIKALRMEEEHLFWMLGLATHFHAEYSGDLHLRYILPDPGDDSTLDVTINMSVLKTGWRSVHAPDSENITYDEILGLRKKCYEKLRHVYGLDVSVLHLTQIKCKDFLLSVNGQIKFSSELADLLLQFIHNVGYGQESGITG